MKRVGSYVFLQINCFFFQIEKHMPMHLRRKLRRQNKPKALHFEMMPSEGHLAPGQRMNVQVKFMPTESVT